MELPASDIVYLTAECVVGLMSVLGNALVLLAIYRTRALRTVTNCFIGSLAAADLLVGLVIVPVGVLPKSGLPKDFHGCVLLNTAVVLITNISILSLVDVALERYLAISDPFRYQRIMSKRRAMLVVLVTWIVAILLGLIPTLGWNLGSEGFEHCEFTKVIDMRYMIYLIFFGVNIPPLLFMLVIYLYIFHIIRKQQKRVVAQMRVLSREERKSQQNRRREVRGAKGLAYVIILFAVCWIPLHVCNSISLFSPQTVMDFKAYPQLLLFFIVLSHVNSMINPFLYAFSNSKFKRAMWRIICCGRMQQGHNSEGDSELDSMARSRAATRAAFTIANGRSANNHATATSMPAPAEGLRNGKLPNGNGHVNAAFQADSEADADSESEGSERKKKTLKWEQPVATQINVTKPLSQNIHPPSTCGAVHVSSNTEDAVIVLGIRPVQENGNGVSRSPGHVWATPSSRGPQLQDFPASAVPQDPATRPAHDPSWPISPADCRAKPEDGVSTPLSYSEQAHGGYDSTSYARRESAEQTACHGCSPYILSDTNEKAGTTVLGEATFPTQPSAVSRTNSTGRADSAARTTSQSSSTHVTSVTDQTPGASPDAAEKEAEGRGGDYDIHHHTPGSSEDTQEIRPTVLGEPAAVTIPREPCRVTVESEDNEELCVTSFAAGTAQMGSELDSLDFVSLRL